MACAAPLETLASHRARTLEAGLPKPIQQPIEVLLVEDDPDDAFLVDELLAAELNVRSHHAASVDDALRHIDSRSLTSPFDAILLDYGLGAKTGLDLLSELQKRDVSTPVVFLTGHGDEALAVRALKAGAVDYLGKAGLNAESLATAVRHALALRDRDAAVRAARQDLAARELEYRTLFESANDPIVILDPETEKIREANPAACRLYRLDHDRLVGRSLIEFSTDIVRGRAAIEECLRTGQVANFQTVHVAAGGRRLHLLINSSTLDYRGQRSLLIVARDISERIAAEQEIFRLNRALQALNKCSAALVRARDPQDFLSEICQIIVNVGGYQMAWVAGAPNEHHHSIRPLARAGVGQDYLELVCDRYLSSEPMSLLVPSAIRTAEAAVCRDTRTDPRSAAMRKECEQRGFASIIALPLQTDSRVVGALAVYAAEPDAFDEAEVSLLKELAGTVSYGLETLEARRQKERAQEELGASERRLRELIETAEEGIWTLDSEDRTTFVNAKMAQMLGYRPEEMLGRTIYDFNEKDRAEIIRRSMQEQRLARGRYEVPLLRADGTRIITSLNSSPLLDANGDYAGALGMFTDITEQKRAEEKLRSSEVRYRMLFERNLAGVFRADADGALTEANEAFVRMLRYQSADELHGVSLKTLCCAAGDSEPYLEQLEMAGQMMNRELRMLRHDGIVAYLLASLVLLRDDSGKPEAIEGTVVDITERRQLESQLLQSQKMDAIGQLAGGIAHDFNNLLMVFRSYAEMIGEKLQGLAQEQDVRKEIDAILKAADRGAALTRQLLTFGRKQPFSPRVIDVNAVLDTISRVLPRALGEHIRVDVRPAPHLWQVKADPVQIEQLLLNLAVNARDAMPNGGRLTLETANTHLASDYVKLHAAVAPGPYVLLAVSDTGHGIPRDILPRIFEPFFTTKERGKGTGLGLSTVYGIVQQSGGYVWVYSEPGQGTTFKIYLPRAGAVAEPGSPGTGLAGASALAPRACSETILLVEDEEAVRTAARRYLALRGYNVLEASCGEEALRLCDDRGDAPIHLLISDAVMPGMSGSVLARQIEQRRPGIRIVFISGFTEATIGEHALATMSTFLQKPFGLSELARKVREVPDAPGEARAPADKEQLPGTKCVA